MASFSERYKKEPEFRKKHIKRVKKWQDENRERVRGYYRDYYKRNRKKILKERKRVRDMWKSRLSDDLQKVQ